MRKWLLKEWKERKTMNNEELENMNLNRDLAKNKEEVIKQIEQKNEILDVYKDKFDKILKDTEDEFQKNVEQFYIETKQRLEKKPKPKPKKPKN